jgi:hypothetical protein
MLPEKTQESSFLPLYMAGIQAVDFWSVNRYIIGKSIRMKSFLILLSFLVSSLAWAGSGHKTDSNAKSGQTEFNFFENNFTITKKDSILVIYDRYDLSGAGIIKKVYYPGSKQTILINDIPCGKYIVTIQCLGKHHDHYEKILKVKGGKISNVSVRLSEYDEIARDKVIIPSDTIDFSKLSIVTMK